MQTWLVTGGAGFIGGNFVLDAVRRGVKVVNLDALTYAGNLDTLASLEGNPAHVFVQGDIGDGALVASWAEASGGKAHGYDAIVARSLDGGATWSRAQLIGPDLGRFAWRQFVLPVRLAPGTHVLASRATDAAGHAQPAEREENIRGYNNNSWRDHAVTVTVV